MTTKVISVSSTSGNINALSGNGSPTILGTTTAWKASTSGYTATIETSHIFQRGGGFIVGPLAPGSLNQVSRPVSCCSPRSASISSPTRASHRRRSSESSQAHMLLQSAKVNRMWYSRLPGASSTEAPRCPGNWREAATMPCAHARKSASRPGFTRRL
jgi:hypothetical protein